VGVADEISPNSDGTWSEAIQYNFCETDALPCPDGSEPSETLALATYRIPLTQSPLDTPLFAIYYRRIKGETIWLLPLLSPFFR
jgi:hypothetical protein